NGYDGSVTTTGKPGSSKGGLTKAIFEELMGSNFFGITIIKGDEGVAEQRTCHHLLKLDLLRQNLWHHRSHEECRWPIRC
ncbi:hypothetical protein PENTCL1PPCAC_15244, partial [Pristionchus entomophagus]